MTKETTPIFIHNLIVLWSLCTTTYMLFSSLHAACIQTVHNVTVVCVLNY